MTIPNSGQSMVAAEAEGAAGTESDARRPAAHSRQLPYRWLWIPLLTGLLIVNGAVQLPNPASARGMNGDSIGFASAGRSTGFSGVNTHRFDLRRGEFFARGDFDRFRDFRRFHRRDRDEFADGFFPFGSVGDFGWGWPGAQPDLFAGGDGPELIDDPPFQRRFGRYERPTVETTASGVTIIRGPGSRH
jgi:hypothetical protein